MQQQTKMGGESKGFYLGLDLGQVADYTTLVLVERVSPKSGPKLLFPRAAAKMRRGETPEKPGDLYPVRQVERVPLGTGYPDIVRYVTERLASPKLAGARVTLAVDATGVGSPVFQMFEEAIPSAGLERTPEIIPVVITAGYEETDPHGYFGIPKRSLAGRAVKYVQKKQLSIPRRDPHYSVLMKELTSFSGKQNLDTGNLTYEAWRERDHDDLVLALCKALWAAERGDQTGFSIPLSELRGQPGSGLRLK